MKKISRNYVKIVEWSDEDDCYIGSCPGLFYGGCHGKNANAVFKQLCKIADEVVELYETDGKPLPLPTAGKDFANKMLSVV